MDWPKKKVQDGAGGRRKQEWLAWQVVCALVKVVGGSDTGYNYATWHAGCANPPAHPMPQAVKQIGGAYYCYDKNGNLTKRVEGGVTYSQNFNVENELSSVVVGGQTTSFTYDAAGQRVKTAQPNGVITDYPFPGYEVENPTGSATVRITFAVAGQAVALRVGSVIYHLYHDHLGSTAVIGTSGAGVVSGSRASYLPYGSYRLSTTTRRYCWAFLCRVYSGISN